MTTRAMKHTRPEIGANANNDPDVQDDLHRRISEDAIAARAYELWQQRGSPVGSPEIDWRLAEDQLRKST